MSIQQTVDILGRLELLKAELESDQMLSTSRDQHIRLALRIATVDKLIADASTLSDTPD